VNEEEGGVRGLGDLDSSSSLLLSSLELSDTNVYKPQIRARLGTAAHFFEVGDLGSLVGEGVLEGEAHARGCERV